MEHILCSNISEHLDKHNIHSDYQHGFRAKRSCETQLVQTIEDLSKSLNDKQQIDMAILDFSKAFDTVSHSKFLYKVNHYGIRNNTLNWIKSWITNRTQQVVLNGATSNQAQVKSGAPQGTVMGQLVFPYLLKTSLNAPSLKFDFSQTTVWYIAISTLTQTP